SRSRSMRFRVYFAEVNTSSNESFGSGSSIAPSSVYQSPVNANAVAAARPRDGETCAPFAHRARTTTPDDARVSPERSFTRRGHGPCSVAYLMHDTDSSDNEREWWRDPDSTPSAGDPSGDDSGIVQSANDWQAASEPEQPGDSSALLPWIDDLGQ